jgi:putative ABC transport system permease protein
MLALRTAARSIARRPAGSVSLVVTIALGIGATTAIFTVVDAVLLRPAPFREPARLANVWTLEKGGFSHPGLEPDVADYWRERSGVFARVESYAQRTMLFSGADEPIDVQTSLVSPGLFSLLGVHASLGRTLIADDAKADAPNVVVVTSELWHRQLGGTRDAIGRPIVLDGRQYIVVGVMPDWFRFPFPNASAWLPIKPGTLSTDERQWVRAVGRIRDGLTPAAAQQRVQQIATQLDATTPRKASWAVALFFLDRKTLNDDVKRTLWVLAGAVLCLLGVACANAASLLLVRATARHRELAIRSALGATRGALVRQLIAESLLLAALGGALGVAIAYWSVDLLIAIVPKEMSYLTYSTIGIDTRVLAFALLATVTTGFLFGVGPAIRASRARGAFAVQDRSGTATRATSTVRGALIVGEVAVSLVLLAGAALFARSFLQLNSVDPGFDAAHFLTVRLNVPASRYPTPEQRAQVTAEYRDRLRQLAGVRSVSIAVGLPPRSGVQLADRVEAEGAPAPLSRDMTMLPFVQADSALFSTLGIRIIRGRPLSEEDRGAPDKRAVVDPDLARALWPNADAIGRRFRLGPEEPWITVVGVSAEVKLDGPDESAGKFGVFYPLPRRAGAAPYVELAVRTAGDPRRAVDAVKRAIWSVDAQQPIASVSTEQEALGEALAKPRFLLALMAIFAGTTLVLAVIGLYGVLAHAVAQRTREIGIRMALGAQTSTILRSVLGYGGALAALGIAFGLGLTVAGGRIVHTLLFGVAPVDPLALAMASVTLVVAALLACYVPASRATKVDPLVALRSADGGFARTGL